jgi:formylglycine-generating enzyme required for sulfatase activity
MRDAYSIHPGIALMGVTILVLAAAPAAAAQGELTSPRVQEAVAVRQDAEQSRQIEMWLAQAQAAASAGRLVEPDDRSAIAYLNLILSVQPDHEQALAARSEVELQLLERADAAASELDFERANDWLNQAEAVGSNPARIARVRADITAERDREIAALEQQIRLFSDRAEFNRAEILLIDLVALGASREQVSSLRSMIEQSRVYGAFDPREEVRDPIAGTDAFAPPIVVIPAGSFLMGAAENDASATEDQRPQHRVTITRGFALGKTEVTVGQFRAFVRTTQYRTEAEIEGFSKVYEEGSGRLTRKPGINWRHDYAGERADEELPVIHVSWNDAQAYVSWLTRATGKPYRLPSEAEFEYVLRAGSAGTYWWGEGSPPEPFENLSGDGDQSPMGRNWSVAFSKYADGHWGPAPVTSFTANPFGIYDIAGNVSEWVRDCWHSSYLRAPTDGSPWVNPGCPRRVIRGGYWAGAPSQARSTARLYGDSDLRGPRVGFRIARDL